MRVRVLEFDLGARQVTTRLPFRFGVTTLTAAPLLLLRARVEVDRSERCEGFASDLLVPKWFEKDPAKSVEEDIDALLRSARDACADALDLEVRPSAFDLWRELNAARVEVLPPHASDRLVRGFGVSLVERAVLDAAGRAAQTPFVDLVRSGRAGFTPGALHADLSGIPSSEALDATPRAWMHVRHTVGLADAVRRGQVADADRLEDGLPESLEEDVEQYGLQFFKIKIAGDLEGDLERLRRIDETIAPRVPGYAFTLDGNEQLSSIADLRALLDALARTDSGRAMRQRLLYVEQPLARAVTYEADRLDGIDALGADVIIDEADTGIDAFARALACGYRGVSVKNCKGVFRAIANRLLAKRRGGFQSAEDLTNLPVVPLQQDLATVAALGLEHVERNGHHYFRGLDHLPPADRDAAIEHHGDLYAARPDGGAALRIENGRVRLGTLQCPGYGVAFCPDFDAWPKVDLTEVESA